MNASSGQNILDHSLVSSPLAPLSLLQPNNMLVSFVVRSIIWTTIPKKDFQQNTFNCKFGCQVKQYEHELKLPNRTHRAQNNFKTSQELHLFVAFLSVSVHFALAQAGSILSEKMDDFSSSLVAMELQTSFCAPVSPVFSKVFMVKATGLFYFLWNLLVDNICTENSQQKRHYLVAQ